MIEEIFLQSEQHKFMKYQTQYVLKWCPYLPGHIAIAFK